MPIALQFVLALSPLAIYFLCLGAWQSGRDPQVVPGVLDYGLLAFGVGGVIAFGPIGSGLIRLLFPGESVWAWLASPTLFSLVALLRAPSAHKRVVIYNVAADDLESALAKVIAALPGRFSPTLRGYEDAETGRGLWCETSRRSRTAVLEAFGPDPESLAAAIAPLLRASVRGMGLRNTAIARVWFSLAALVIWVPMIAVILSRAHVRAALRALLERLHGG